MFISPSTIEDLDRIINTIMNPGSTAPRVSLPILERNVQKARFYINKEDLDYV